MTFGMAVDCSNCGCGTTCLFVAQYKNGWDREAFICNTCYSHGFRCWVLGDGSLVVSDTQPNDSQKAVLYWDEGGAVTGGGLNLTYPSELQPKVSE